MKIGEYIELVKQADFTDGNSQWEAATRAPASEPPTGGEPLQLDPAQTGAKPKSVPEFVLPRPIDQRTGLLKRPKENPFNRNKFEFDLSPLKNPAEGRSWWKYFTDYGNRQAWKDWWEYTKQDKFNGERVGKSTANEAVGMLKSLFNKPIKPVDFDMFRGPIGKAFPPLIALENAKKNIEQNATDRAYLNGVNVDGDRTYGDYFSYLPYYYSELFKEVGRSSPSILTEGISFVNPVAPLTMTGEVLAIPARLMGYNGKVVPGFYHPQYQYNRISTNADWENRKNPEYINPEQLKQNSERYGNTNYWIDNGAAYLDPVFQTAGWLGDKVVDFNPFLSPIRKYVTKREKPLYEHIMDNIGELRGKPTKYNVAPDGTKTVDWQDFVNGTGWYDLNGGRPEFRNMPIEKRIEQIKPWIDKAIQNGYTRDEIEKAVERYIMSSGDPDVEGGSLLYTDANMLPLMAMSPTDIYNSMEFQNTVTDPEDIKGIPRYIRKFVPGYMGSPGGYTNDENPKWLEAKKSLERRIADQKTLFKLYPFFEAIKGSPDQLTDEERELISNPANLARIQAIAAPNIDLKDILHKIPIAQEGSDNYDEELQSFITSHMLNRLSRLPAQQRYSYFLQYPEGLDIFLNRFYTNEDTKNKIRKFLFPDRATPQELEQIAPVAKPVGTLTSTLIPSLLKVRQQIANQQRRNELLK